MISTLSVQPVVFTMGVQTVNQMVDAINQIAFALLKRKDIQKTDIQIDRQEVDRQKMDAGIIQWHGKISETNQNHSLALSPAPVVTLSPPHQMMPQQIDSAPALDILVADDNIVNQKVVLHMLKRVGYQADVVGDGMEVLDALQHKSYDIVLMDIQMPRMDGITATKTIKAQFPSEQQPCIIAVTANAMPGDRERCLEAGMDDYISKPVRLEKLVAALDKATPRHATSSDSPDSNRPDQDPSQDDIPDIEQSPPIDIGAFEEMVGPDSLDFLIELLDAFLLELPNQLTTLHQAVDTGNIETVRRVAHSLTGNAGGLAAHDLAKIARDLEAEAREEDLSQAEGKIRLMEREQIRLKAWLKKMAL